VLHLMAPFLYATLQHFIACQPDRKAIHRSNLESLMQLPNGEIHLRMARFELEPVGSSGKLLPGTRARIVTDKGHPPQVQTGMIVKVLKIVTTPYYDAYVQGKYHRWFAHFEIFPESVLRS
jgi:hypothetical protein